MQVKKNIDEIGTKDLNTSMNNSMLINSNEIVNVALFGTSNKAILQKVTFQLAKKAIEKACLDVITNGFTFEQVQDDNYANKASDDSSSINKYAGLDFKRERLGDLQSVLYTSAIQNLNDINSFVSITDIVMRCFIKTDNDYINDVNNSFNYINSVNYIYFDSLTGKNKVFYGFIFSGCIIDKTQGDAENRVIYPKTRSTLLGIHPLTRVEETGTKKVTYQAYLGGKAYTFDNSLVFVTEYAIYDELFKSIFELQATLLGNITKEMNINNILQVSAPNNYFSLPEEGAGGQKAIREAFANLMTGNSDGIITTNNYDMKVHNITETGTIQKTGVDVFSNAVGFITGIPQTILFGTQQKTWASTSEEDRIKYEFFLEMLAETYFLPILHNFCKVLTLKDWDKLEYKTTASIREKLNIWSTIVPDELKTEERLYHIGLEIDKLLGIDSKTKEEIKKQLGVETDSKEEIKKKSNNTKNSNKYSQKNGK